MIGTGTRGGVLVVWAGRGHVHPTVLWQALELVLWCWWGPHPPHSAASATAPTPIGAVVSEPQVVQVGVGLVGATQWPGEAANVQMWKD